MNIFKTLKTLVFTLALSATMCLGQNVAGAGTQPTDTVQAGISLNNLNIHLDIPTAPGMAIHYNSNMWQNNGNGSTWALSETYTNNNYPWGMNTLVSYFPPQMGVLFPAGVSCGSGKVAYSYTNWIDPAGNTHVFSGVTLSPSGGTYGTCSGTVSSSSFLLTDGSGVTVNLNANAANTVVDSSGNVTTFGGNGWFTGNPPGNLGIGISQTDTNGNSSTLSLSSDLLTGTVTTPLGAQMSVVGSCGLIGPGAPVTYSYPTPQGINKVVITCGQIILATKFSCSGISDFNGFVPTANPKYVGLPVSIALPDGSKYSFTYEAQVAGSTTARISSITYPNGSTTTYAYTGANGGVNCSDGTTSGLTVTNSDGTWTYTRNLAAGTTTVVSPTPASNATVYTFVQQAGSPFASFATQVKTYSGSVSSSVLSTKLLCYNGNTTSCATATAPTFPLTEVDSYITPDSGSYSSRTQTLLDSYGNTTQVASYDFGAATPTSKTVSVSFGDSWNGSSCVAIGSSVNSKPCKVLLENGSSTILRTTLFTYDSNGNLKKEQVGTLTSSATYNSNGTPAIITDVAGNTTSLTYGQCNKLLLTKIVPPITSLATTSTWDSTCLGLLTSATDANSAKVSSTYNDPLLRITSATDALGNATNFTYTPSTVENTFVAGVNIDNFLTLDSLGRTLYAQSKNPTGTWNTSQYGYTWNATGRVTTTNVPCTSTKGSGGCNTGTTTITSDALGRGLVETDGGGGTITNTYTTSTSCTASESQCEVVTSTLGPAPAGEVVKEVAEEYNGLGQLLASCTISSAATSTACGFGGYTGFPTVYVYNVDGTLSSAAKSSSTNTQTHTFTYDSLGRVLTANYPESGTTTYTYDTTTTTGCAAYTGKLVKSKDANGNTTCYLYDTLGRLTQENYSGPNFDGAYKQFIWDNSTCAQYCNITTTNTEGRLAETLTAYSTSGTWIAVEVYGYSLRGELTDVWEATPNSGGYYHTSAAYFPSGALQTLALSGYKIWNYTIDSMGRPYGAMQGDTTLVSSTSYNASSQPTSIVFSSKAGNVDSYVYDNNTGRMLSYTFSPNTANDEGQLTWNANGTLNELSIVDLIQPTGAGSQNCTYSYDEQARINQVGCLFRGSSIWSQVFSYDAFGNITKTGSGVWNPGYNENNNRITGATYDSNGNVLNDTIHKYSWNQDNHVLTVTGGTSSPLVYDANGNRVEQFFGTTYKESLLSPIGNLGLMSKTAVSQLRVPLPGGSIYDPSTNNVWHPDWQGSYRLISNLTSGASVADRAFAPYGEVYNNIGSAAFPNFTGDNQDLLGGVYDTPNRELDETQGRWVSVDPSHSSWNGYAYTSNPLGEVDPSGLDPEGPPTSSDPGDSSDNGSASCINGFYCQTSTTQRIVSNQEFSPISSSPLDPGGIAGYDAALENFFDESGSEGGAGGDFSPSALETVGNVIGFLNFATGMDQQIIGPMMIDIPPGYIMDEGVLVARNTTGVVTIKNPDVYADRWTEVMSKIGSGKNTGTGDINPAHLMGYTRGQDPTWFNRILDSTVGRVDGLFAYRGDTPNLESIDGGLTGFGELMPQTDRFGEPMPLGHPIPYTQIQLYEKSLGSNFGQPGFGEMYPLQNVYYFPAIQLKLFP